MLTILCAAWYGVETSFPDHLLPAGNRPSLYTDTTMAGKVVGITDGDTFRLFLADSSVIKIRIAGIDCPERKQPFSTRAKQFTSDAIFSKHVQVAVQDKDRYGRYIAQVHYGRKDLGKELLRNGMAWHYVRYSSDKNLQQLEDRARAAKVGLWVDENAVPPWEWRKGVGSGQ